jgi:predicted Zn-dependent peptidase
MKIKEISQPSFIHIESANRELGAFGFKKYGGAENEARPGISHLCEHLMCRAWDDFDSYFVERYIDKNAATGNTSVQYYFAGLDSLIPEIIERIACRPGLRSLREWLPSEAEFNRERKVVVQEYEGYLTNAFHALLVNLGRRYYNWSGPIGRLDVIQETTYQQFVDIFNDQRKFDVFMYSGARHTEVDALADVLIADGPRVAIDSIRPYRKFCEYSGEKIEYYGKSSQQTFIGDWIEVDDTVAPWEIAALSSMFDDGTNSPMMSELRQKSGLAYTAQCFHAASTLPIFMSYVTVNPDNVQKARELLHNVYANWQDHISLERYESVMRGLRVRNELRSAKNYEPGSMLAISNPLELECSNTNLDGFSYERVCNILSQFFKRENIRVAEVGDEVKI